jgi:hypothetical protein
MTARYPAPQWPNPTGFGDAWRQRHRGCLATLAQHGERAVTALEAEGADVGTDRPRHTQPIERKQRDEGVVAG